MKKKKLTASMLVIQIIICVLMTMMLLYFIFSLQNCSEYFDGEAKAVSQQYTLQNTNSLQHYIDLSFDEIKGLATKISSVTGYEKINAVGNDYITQYGYGCLMFYNNGEAEYRFGESIGSSTSQQLKELIAAKKYGCSEIFTDMSLGVECVAVYSPVDGNNEIDGVVAYFQVSNLFTNDIINKEMLEYYCIAETDGNILKSYSADGFKTDVSHNAYTYLENISDSKSKLDKLENNVLNRINSSYNFNINGEEYIISCISLTKFGNDCFVINIYSKKSLLQQEYFLYDRLIGSSAGIIVLSITIMIIYLVSMYNNKNQLIIMDEIDPILGCNTFNKFSRQATEILSFNRHSSYALVYFDVNKYTYIKKHFDSGDSEATLRHISTVIKKLISDNETYGHISDDRFVALMHCFDIKEFENRIRVIQALAANLDIIKSNNFSLTIAVGIYIVDRTKNYTINDMLDRASIAQKINKKNSDKPFVYYDSSIRSSYLKEAEIESKMEYSLKSREFKIFFQPKYNIIEDKIDGAEALVRWYDSERNTYMVPDTFIPLFEVNGFVSKLDRYVFENVCKYMHEATIRGEKTVPISINVSRVTAIQPDFLSYYINTKQNYGIADGFLIIEFTESFAYEDYDAIFNIVSTLHKYGFKCSIDDFGAGYSSFGILKELQMDELKLDKFFLDAGTDASKDEILLKTIIGLGNSFNMKVTQEGVETADQLKKLSLYGCSVIQGYYYSKPLSMSDYIDFVNKDTSLNCIINYHIDKEKNKKQRL